MKYVLALTCLFASGAALADAAQRQGFWGAVDLGYGSVHLTPDVADASTRTRLYLGLEGGYTVHPQVQLGVSVGGWSLRHDDWWNPLGSDEGMHTLFAVARIRPAADSRLFIKVGGGSATHWNNAQGADRGSGSAYVLGMGYRLGSYAATETYWFVNYTAGSVSDYRPPGGVSQDEDFGALTAGLTLGF